MFNEIKAKLFPGQILLKRLSDVVKGLSDNLGGLTMKVDATNAAIIRMEAEIDRLNRDFAVTRSLLSEAIHEDHVKYGWNKSFAQTGEDLILAALFINFLKIDKPSYLDIGTNHPSRLNNTFFFYRFNCTGVCVEANPHLIDEIKAIRPRDKCLNVGVGDSSQRADFYVMEPSTMSTFSTKDFEAYKEKGIVHKETIPIEMVPVNVLIEKHFTSCPNLVSLDTEGNDEVILKAFDFQRFRPEVFCVETVEYREVNKNAVIDDLMAANGYVKYADTFINSIYVDSGKLNAALAAKDKS
ncbi:FkbM family methyltransferase [Verrucomicrobia bacterium LW23]|nr:FkbM family methyltransferase [Verrucomicrobia bacterium LW23]